MDCVNICFICDDKFSLPTGVAIQSLSENRNVDIYYNVYIICYNVSIENKNKLVKMNQNKFSVQLIDLSNIKKYDNLSITGLHVTPTALFKFDLPNIFSDLEKIIYIDGDVLIKEDLYPLYSIDIDNEYAGVVRDRRAFFYKRKTLYERLKIDYNEYFNTGMMVLNLKKMRDDNIPYKLLDYRLKGKNDFMDQDAFNVVFGNCVRYLSLKYNSITTCINDADIEHINQFYLEEKFNSKEDLFNKSIIWHFASPEKPWKYTNVKYRKYWLQYYYKSSFKDIPLENNVFDFEKRSEKISRLKSIIGENYSNVKLSIIIPVYNSEYFISECLDSIIQQTVFENFEVICIDDGSTDNTYFVLKLYQRRDPRIRIFHQKNLYAGVARNKGIESANGEYITFIDADDKLSSGKALKNILELAYKNNADMACCNARDMYPNGKDVGNILSYNLRTEYIPKKSVFSIDELNEFAFLTFGGAPWSKLYKRNFLLKNNIKFLSLKRSEDFYFVQISLIKADRISISKESLIHHRRETGNNLEAKKDETPLIFWEADKMFYSYLLENGLYDKYELAAKLVSLNRFRYNLFAMKTFDGFKTVYEYGKKEILPYLNVKDKNIVLPDYIKITITEVENTQSAGEFVYFKWKNNLNRLVTLENKIKHSSNIEKGYSYRIGRKITFVPRKIRGTYRCYKTYGLVYTLKRIKKEIRKYV